jgi:anti-sigma B factor antagonist
MFEIRFGENEQIVLHGRFDAAQTVKADEFFKQINESRIVDCGRLEYISSAGLGVLLKVQKRLQMVDEGLTLANLNNHIVDVFRYAGLDRIFKIGQAGD